ncbi:MAG: DNA helicase-2/ATP-dependent DNA helicase PcrA, partial [Paracoccaceae bacterium]
TLGIPLRFYVTQQTRNGDRHLYANRTRFIPKEILNDFEAVYWAPSVNGDSRRQAPAPIDISARLRGMWQ